jgi:hypothetical protein
MSAPHDFPELDQLEFVIEPQSLRKAAEGFRLFHIPSTRTHFYAA